MQYPKNLNPKHRDLLDCLAEAEKSLKEDSSNMNYAYNTGRLLQGIKSFLFTYNIGITFETIKDYCNEYIPLNERNKKEKSK